jgi:hypothetical protein
MIYLGSEEASIMVPKATDRDKLKNFKMDSFLSTTRYISNKSITDEV